ncbi:hypothetical protein Q7P37_010435 [Cladosporium fusiforme]
MKLLFFSTLLSLAAVALAAPAAHWDHDSGSGQNEGHRQWGGKSNGESPYADFSRQWHRGRDSSRGSCDLKNAVMPAAPIPLPPPASGRMLSHVAIGRGNQNYTCDLSNSTAIPVPAGAVATLFNVSCLAADMPELLARICPIALDLPIPSAQDANSPIYQGMSGHHYFTDNTTPFFDLDTGAHAYGNGAFKKGDSTPAPEDSVPGPYGDGNGSVAWLRLDAKTAASGQAFQEVYRLNTAGGQPPKTCQGMPETFEVPGTNPAILHRNFSLSITIALPSTTSPHLSTDPPQKQTMSSNVGLSTPRGSGTSGYVQRNLSNLKPRDNAAPYPSADAIQDLKHRQRQPDKEILEHERKRDIEVKVFELRDRLEEEGIDEDEIDTQCDSLRKKLTTEQARSGGGAMNGKGLKSHQVHELAKAKIEESEKLRRALGIRKDYEEGSHWRRQEERAAEREKGKPLERERERGREERRSRSRTAKHNEKLPEILFLSPLDSLPSPKSAGSSLFLHKRSRTIHKADTPQHSFPPWILATTNLFPPQASSKFRLTIIHWRLANLSPAPICNKEQPRSRSNVRQLVSRAQVASMRATPRDFGISQLVGWARST